MGVAYHSAGANNHALLFLHHLLLSISVRVSGESDAEEKQRRFQESLMSTRSRSLPNYPCLSFSFCLFSSLHHPLCSLIFSFTRRESNRCLPCCGVEVKWRWSCLLVERLVPWEAADSWSGMACLRSVAFKTKAWFDSFVWYLVIYKGTITLGWLLEIWMEKLKASKATFLYLQTLFRPFDWDDLNFDSPNVYNLSLWYEIYRYTRMSQTKQKRIIIIFNSPYISEERSSCLSC